MANLPNSSARLKISLFGIVMAAFGLAGYTLWERPGPQEATADLPVITVFKSPTCGCCTKWVDYLRENGFEVQAEDRTDMQAVKEQFGIPERLSSCHTALVGEYVVEGHVPAADIQRLLSERPAVAGLTVPGMPVGSPGMEQGNRVDPYDVLTFSKDGSTAVYAQYGK